MLLDLRSLEESTGASTALDPGSIVVQGHDLTWTLTTALAAGAITVAGQSVTWTYGQAIDNGSITIAGQSLTTTYSVALSNGSISIAGQSASWALTQALSAGSISIDGQSITTTYNVPLSNGSIAINGQNLTTTIGTTTQLDPGSITIQGQDLTVVFTGTTQEPAVGGYRKKHGGGGVLVRMSKEERERLAERILRLLEAEDAPAPKTAAKAIAKVVQKEVEEEAVYFNTVTEVVDDAQDKLRIALNRQRLAQRAVYLQVLRDEIEREIARVKRKRAALMLLLSPD